MTKDKMKAVVCDGYGGPEVLKIDMVDKPIPRSNELLIKIIVTSVNSGDVTLRALKANFLQKIIMRLIFGWNKPRNPILGTVYSGIVEQVGKAVKDFNVGDEVFGLRGFSFGTYAEYVSVKENSVISKKPVNASFEEAAALLFGGQTAHYFIHKSNIPKVSGLNIMVYGGTSSVGTAAIQIAKYYGAVVTAVCSDYSEDLVLKLGADKTIFYNKVNFTKSLEKYDVIFDAVGKISRKQCSHMLKHNGTYLTVSGLDYAKESRSQIYFLKELFEKGNYDASIDKTFYLDEIVDAHKYVDTGRKKGNVILKISECHDHQPLTRI